MLTGESKDDGEVVGPASSTISTTADDAEMQQKLEDLNKTLETEKASRTDLEMYVAVIETQKKVLQVCGWGLA